MSTKKSNLENRIFFMDNMRSLIVLGVVLLHSGCAYLKIFTWWPVADTSSTIVGGITLFLDVFVMPLLFYIAGYFALPSIQGKNILSFLTGKLKRLGIPWFACLVTIIPAYFFIYHYTRNNLTLPMSYWDFWVMSMKNFSQFSTMLIDTGNRTQFLQSYHIHQSYLWFLSLLLVFFFIFSIVYKVKKSWFDRSDQPATPVSISILSTLKFILIVGFITFFWSLNLTRIMFIFTQTTDPEAWFTLGNILIFQPSRLFLYVIYFILGIITFKKKWIERGRFSGHFKTWLTSLIISSIGYFYVYNILSNNVFIKAPIEVIKKNWLVFFFIRNVLVASILGVFISLAVKYWNRPTKFNRSLSLNSYNIYLVHFIFVLIFQLILLAIPGIPVVLKFGVVSVLSILCAYLVSQFLMKPFPRIAVAVTFIMLIAMFRVI